MKKLADQTVTKNLLKEVDARMGSAIIVEKADALVKKRETFELTTLARSNDELYGILSEVYALFKSAVEEKHLKEVLVKMKAALKTKNIKVQVNSPALTVFVRYVFNSDRKRAYNYASTLMAAVQSNIEPANLAEFIKSKSGVEECKKEYKKTDDAKARESAVKDACVAVSEGLLTMKTKHRVKLQNSTVDYCDGTDFAFIVARSLGNGEFDLLRVVPKSTKAMQGAAIKELAKALIEQTEKAKTEAKETKAKSTTDKAVSTITPKQAAKMTVGELEAV
jgi:hypothetical protein